MKRLVGPLLIKQNECIASLARSAYITVNDPLSEGPALNPGDSLLMFLYVILGLF